MWPDRRLLDLLHIEHPIILAPMGGAMDWELTAAVAEAGGLGSLPCMMHTPAQAREMVRQLREATKRPISLGFFCHQAPEQNNAREAGWRDRLAPYYAEFGLDPRAPVPAPLRAPFNDESCDMVVETKPNAVSFHFGLPDAALVRGHRGVFLSDDISTQVGTFALVPQVVDAVKVPVVAAGGIADARGIAAAFALGACGVQLGTAYLHCPESRISAPHRKALANAKDNSTVLTNVMSGRPARGIVNRVIRELGPISDIAPAFPSAANALAPLRAAAEKQGSGDFSPLWSGQAAALGRAVPAGELTRQLAEAALARLRTLSK
jgi:nitronate monooxygenase